MSVLETFSDPTLSEVAEYLGTVIGGLPLFLFLLDPLVVIVGGALWGLFIMSRRKTEFGTT